MNAMTDLLLIPDIQGRLDERALPIQFVGVNDVRYPVTLQVDGVAQPTTATWKLGVALPAHLKGTHMSRFLAWLESAPDLSDTSALRTGLSKMLERFDADEGRIEAGFSFFLRKRAPVSGLSSLLDYEGRWIAERVKGQTTVWAEVTVPVKTLCPCSKEISDYGAHNQRSAVTIRVELRDGVAWHELVRFAEDNASSELWSLLKRADEKWVTERAYENPKFVEDLVRDVALSVSRDPRVGRYSIGVENFESIHNHSAYACIEHMGEHKAGAPT